MNQMVKLKTIFIDMYIYILDLFILGQLTFPACQICLDENESMVTMKVISLYLLIE